jgi:hypothetical protein
VGKCYRESQKYEDRARTQQEHLLKLAASQAGGGGTPPGARSGTPGGEWTALEYLMLTGALTRLIVRPEGQDGASFTIKANLPGRGACYLHGKVSNTWELPRIVEDVINKGKWHEDKYPAKE